MCRIWNFAAFALLFAASLPAFAAEPQDEAADKKAPAETQVRAFLNNHCARCHGAKRANSGFRVDDLPADFHTGDAADRWNEVMDKINLGEMPPEDEKQPTAAEFEPVVTWINARLRTFNQSVHDTGGQIPMRRLNRMEYANTVRDLFQIDANLLGPIVEELPADGKAAGFDRLGAALFFDETQVEKTLEAAEQVAALAIVDEKPAANTKRYEFEKNPRVARFKKMTRSRFADTLVDAGPSGSELVGEGVRVVHGYGNRSKTDPWGRLGNATFEDVVTQDGYYKVRIRAGASAGSRGLPMKVRVLYASSTPVQFSTVIDIKAPLDKPEVHEALVFLRSGPTGLKKSVGFSFNDIADLIVSTPENNRFFRDVRRAIDGVRDAKADGGTAAEIAAAEQNLRDVRAEAAKWKGPIRHYNPDRDSANPPTIFVDWAEVSGPVYPDWPPKSHKALLFAGNEREDEAYAREIFAKFLPRAYRRPVSKAELQGVLYFVQQAIKDGATFNDAIRRGVARVLCSPGFLFTQEPSTASQPRKLNGYELASRLSYYLWSSMPDQALFDLAKSGQLLREDVLLSQVDRMLDDPKAEALVQGFAGQWLHVQEFGNVMPAASYSNYYDAKLEESSKLEAYAFFREVLHKNLPVTNFLDSDFVMINERLAKHYGIEDVKGAEIRRVPVEPAHHRGGVLGMAGLMTLLSDGTRTLPVRRAAWVKTQLFGDPPGNPPPNAGEIQPNTAGKKLTVRQRLALHRNETTCASCHKKLDPFGLALENYDAIGMWRTKANGEGFRSRNAPELDVSGEFPGGETFKTLEEYKAGLLARKDAFTRNLIEQMLTYALTRPAGYADRQTVDGVLQAMKNNEYRLRTLVREIVRSNDFQSK